ncbi:4-hydroxybenzoate 3-monooxygenase [Pseudonocardia benzenivorans]|jgi:p-hydroxybenzoate 3-monooxygenase|uniref:4-hydroxybenzoate 3-monooxygenase n=2 Tax=Pseudonocardia TaxID=1847 RepID=F4CVI2_PSEUX|nr:4-hydroxybenzoate 3-monooxygenase [Pseudonocardia dioxanivorans]AEA23802.1 4-hydroxybenzoate 3-monooxygenase [Pseudonocardia dioxanivorans CB1190]GJF03328.1 4-hydroxybenzoate 3-monooxygenase [Pseudonocardia sp. D17]
MRTQVAIVGAGPAGLLLSHLLARRGVDSVVVEARSRSYVEHRVRAGVLEHPTVELLRAEGVGARMDAHGMPHEGISLLFDDTLHHIDFADLVGRGIVVYGQQEVVKDLIAARLRDGGTIEFEAADVALHGLTTDRPSVSFTDVAGITREIECDVVAGCDGFHGPSRQAFAPTVVERAYPFGWLGVLAEAAPTHEELVYAAADRGFALYSMRSPQVTRLYLQVPADEDVAAWSDARIWDELGTRLGGMALNEGPFLEKPSITGMRSMVAEPMRHGRLFLAGDAAHIVPPTGAKGMNLAVADVAVLADALEHFFHRGSDRGLDEYSATCLRRVWRAEHFSSYMTEMLHRFDPGTERGDAFGRALQLSQLRYTVSSRAAATSLAENYTGLPHGGIA